MTLRPSTVPLSANSATSEQGDRGWVKLKLKHLVALKSGDSITSDAIEAQGKYPVYGGNGHRGFTDAYTHDGEYALIGRQGALCGNVKTASGRFWASEHAVVASPRHPVSLGWLAGLLESMDLGQHSMTAAQPGLSVDTIANLEVAVPPLPEQRRIADFLDAHTANIDLLIGKQERLIATLAERRQAVISHAVTKGLDTNVEMVESGVGWIGAIPSAWNVVQLKWLSQVKRGASPRPIDDPKYFDESGDWAWVRIADVSSSSGRLTSTTQTLSDLGSSLSVKLEPGALFVSIAGTVGKPCITDIRACIHDGFVYFPRLKYSRDLLYRIFEAGDCYAGLGKMGTQLNLNTDTIGSIFVPVPPDAVQLEIVEHLDRETAQIDALSAKAREMVVVLKERRQALISAAVTGKIDVRGLS